MRPDVRLAIREGPSAALEEWVVGRQVDISLVQIPGIGRTRRPAGRGRAARVGVGCAGSLFHGSHPCPATRGPGSWSSERAEWTRRLVESAAFRRGVVFDKIQEVEGVALLKEMTRTGLGCTVSPLATVREEVAHGTLAFRPFEHDLFSAVHAVAIRGGIPPAPFVVDMSVLLHGVMSDMVRDGSWVGASPVGSSKRAPEVVMNEFAGDAAG